MASNIYMMRQLEEDAKTLYTNAYSDMYTYVKDTDEGKALATRSLARLAFEGMFAHESGGSNSPIVEIGTTVSSKHLRSSKKETIGLSSIAEEEYERKIRVDELAKNVGTMSVFAISHQNYSLHSLSDISSESFSIGYTNNRGIPTRRVSRMQLRVRLQEARTALGDLKKVKRLVPVYFVDCNEQLSGLETSEYIMAYYRANILAARDCMQRIKEMRTANLNMSQDDLSQHIEQLEVLRQFYESRAKEVGPVIIQYQIAQGLIDEDAKALRYMSGAIQYRADTRDAVLTSNTVQAVTA